jgi:hypothetical protein
MQPRSFTTWRLCQDSGRASSLWGGREAARTNTSPPRMPSNATGQRSTASPCAFQGGGGQKRQRAGRPARPRCQIRFPEGGVGGWGKESLSNRRPAGNTPTTPFSGRVIRRGGDRQFFGSWDPLLPARPVPTGWRGEGGIPAALAQGGGVLRALVLQNSGPAKFLGWVDQHRRTAP